MTYSLKDSEETIKNKVRQEFFADYDGTQCFDNIDFSVAVREEGTFVFPEREYLLWAESKAGNKHSLFDSLVQLILTIGKARTLDNALPPHFLGAFDAEKIAFIPFSAVMQVFALNDFNWNVTPSDHSSKEFKLLHQLVKQQIQEHAAQDGQVYIYSFQNDEKELRQFIRRNFISGRDKIQRIRVNHNNFVTIFQKWRREVMPTINVNWDNAKRNNLLDADFFLADLIAENNRTLLDNLHVLLQDMHYELDRHIDTDGLFTSKQVQFSDRMIAHSRFWTRYARPPQQIYWDKIVERRDLLVPQDVRERKGSYFTPAIWVEKSQEYLEKLLGENWQEEYYIWDCCAGTGNLLANLTNKYRIWASTLDMADVKVMHERIDAMGTGANLLKSHVFQFDFLNDSFDDPKLPQSLREILQDPAKRQQLIIYINPPYAEAGNTRQLSGKGKNKKDVAVANKTYSRYLNEIGIAGRELFAQFFIRIYNEIPGAVLAEFSTLKILQAPNFADFRKVFRAKLLSLFLVPADTFDNVKGHFPIGFFIWNSAQTDIFQGITADVFDAKGNLSQSKVIFNYDFCDGNIGKWVNSFRNDQGLHLGFMSNGRNDFQNQKLVYFMNRKDQMPTPRGWWITPENLIPMCIFVAVRHCIEATWLNDRDQFLFPDDGWKNDITFQMDCLAFTLFSNANTISSQFGINHWIPFTEQQLDAPDCFQSHFMSDFLAGKIHPAKPQPVSGTLFDDNACGDDACGVPISPVGEMGCFSRVVNNSPNGEAQQRETTNAQPYIPNALFSPAAQAVMQAGKAVWYYYLHHQSDQLYAAQPDINASFYDIRRFFQGSDAKGKMNTDSNDLTYMALLRDLRAKQKALAAQITPKVYQYGFLK